MASSAVIFILALSRPNGRFTVDTDACGAQIGCFLLQEQPEIHLSPYSTGSHCYTGLSRHTEQGILSVLLSYCQCWERILGELGLLYKRTFKFSDGYSIWRIRLENGQNGTYDSQTSTLKISAVHPWSIRHPTRSSNCIGQEWIEPRSRTI